MCTIGPETWGNGGLGGYVGVQWPVSAPQAGCAMDRALMDIFAENGTGIEGSSPGGGSVPSGEAEVGRAPGAVLAVRSCAHAMHAALCVKRACGQRGEFLKDSEFLKAKL